MTAAVEIREARPEEYEVAGEVAVEGYREFYHESLGTYEAYLRDVTSRATNGFVMVAIDEETGEVVGTVTYVGDPTSPLGAFQETDEASIRMLAVAPAAKRRGIGRALSEACIELARLEGKRAVFLHADEIMKAARDLYENLGFHRDPERDFAPDEETRLVCYALDL